MTAATPDRVAHYEYAMGLLPEMVRRLRWSREQVEAFQESQLNALVTHARENSPWYRSRLRHLPAKVNLECLREIPVMTRCDLDRHWDEIVTVPGASRSRARAKIARMNGHRYVWGDHTLWTSGASSSTPTVFVQGWHAAAVGWAGVARAVVHGLLANTNLGRPLRVANVNAGPSAHGSYVLSRVFSNPRSPVAEISVHENLERIVDTLNRADPDLVYMPSGFLGILTAAQEAGNLRIGPLLVGCSGEPLLPIHEGRARRAWPSARVVQHWGSSEVAGSFPNLESSGFVLSEDLSIFEIRENGIVVTNLYNHALPLIRYALDDLFIMDQAQSPRFGPFRVARGCLGRASEVFSYGDRQVHPSRLAQALEVAPSVSDFQLVQQPNAIELRVVDKPEPHGSIVRRLEEILNEHGLPDLQVSVKTVPWIPRTASGKIRRYLPLDAHRADRCEV